MTERASKNANTNKLSGLRSPSDDTTPFVATLISLAAGAAVGLIVPELPVAFRALVGAVAVAAPVGLFAYRKSRARALHGATIARVLDDLGTPKRGGTQERTASFLPRGGEWGPIERVVQELAGDLAARGGAARRERHLLRRMLAGMREGVLLLGEDRRVDRMNAAFREMFYLSTGDPQGKSLLELIRHSELKSLVDDAFDARGGAEGEIDVGGLSPRRLLVRATFVEGVGVLAVFFDVTEIRALEALRREFVANVSHELRTPVTAVLSAAETARMIAARDPAKAEPFLEIIERNAERLRRLIEDLLDLSRIESNKLKLVPETVELTSFLPMTTALFKERATARRITLTVTASAGVRVCADRRALEQVVTNLVDNAIKYVRDGDEVRVLAEKVGDDVRIVVADSGEGIAAEHLPRLFERFYRVDAGRSRDKGGTGLGLAIVKHLAESMGGAIAVESSRAGATVLGFPSGTAFIVTLPAG